MQSFQTRVIEEKRELDEKLFKLRAFLAELPTTVDLAEEERLRSQESYMDLYSSVLAERIEAFDGS
jgi:hypothetical protein